MHRSASERGKSWKVRLVAPRRTPEKLQYCYRGGTGVAFVVVGRADRQIAGGDFASSVAADKILHFQESNVVSDRQQSDVLLQTRRFDCLGGKSRVRHKTSCNVHRGFGGVE